uniref:Uncharacterized protein n=1 Tax=Faxonius propinquus nudivirus TaxID=3139431 RepID=A0AAU8GBK5_9VIRU
MSNYSRRNFKIFIKGELSGNQYKDTEDCIYLKHDEEYGIGVINNTDVKIIAEYKVANIDVGELVIGPKKTVILDRPLYDTRKFKFVSLKSPEALECGISNTKNINISDVMVTIKPEKKTTYSQRNIASALLIETDSASSRSIDLCDNSNEGGTILSNRKSSQTFHSVPSFKTQGEHIYTILLLEKIEEKKIESLEDASRNW